MSQEIKKQNELAKQEVKGALAVMEKDIADQVFNRVNQMESSQQLMFPPNYAVGNALKSAYLIIQNTKDKSGNSALKVCTKESIANSLLDMVIQGLSPSKTQCYFIARGNQLGLHVSYFGHQKIAKTTVPTISEIYATEIYEGDEIEIEIVDGKRVVTSHKTKFANRDNPIVGVYSVIVNNGVKDYEIMTMKEVQAAWDMSSTKNQTTHKQFPQEMSKKTVLARHCKRYIKTSDDANIFAQEAYERTMANEHKDVDYADTQEALDHQVDVEANQEELIIETDYEDVTPQETPQEAPSDEPAF